MFDFLLGSIFDLAACIYMADKRRDACKFTIGCFLMVVMLIGLLVLIFWDV